MNLYYSKNASLNSFIVLSLLILLLNCSKKKSELVWDKTFYKIGSQSSLRATDLNQDGILDLVLGAGENEYQYSKQGVLAINGVNGDLLWQHETTDQVFGSATFYDVSGDKINDVFIGGRSPNFKAINGATGNAIWKYDCKKYETDPILQYAKFNFYNSILIPDQNNDGISDILTVNGGNSKAPANSERERYPGVLMIFDSKSGEIIKADTMPDGKETYMSPICFSQPKSNDHTIIFGTGGETISGNLYKILLSDFIDTGFKRVNVIASEVGHGFIAPPVAADLTTDGIYDIVAISHSSTIFAINGMDNSIIWKNKIDDAESSNSFGVGYFTDDEIPDLFTFVSKGQWPDNRGSMQVMLDGENGEIAYTNSIGCTGFSSPVIYDLNNDGYDEAIISINEYDCSKGFVKKISSSIINKLIALDFKNNSIVIIDQQERFKNIFTTPWIGDLDKDGYLDIAYCQYFSPNSNILAFLGMKVKRISTHIKIKKDVIWGAYMGSLGNGAFTLEP